MSRLGTVFLEGSALTGRQLLTNDVDLGHLLLKDWYHVGSGLDQPRVEHTLILLEHRGQSHLTGGDQWPTYRSERSHQRNEHLGRQGLPLGNNLSSRGQVSSPFRECCS
jgi:hypothetical protein